MSEPPDHYLEFEKLFRAIDPAHLSTEQVALLKAVQRVAKDVKESLTFSGEFAAAFVLSQADRVRAYAKAANGPVEEMMIVQGMVPSVYKVEYSVRPAAIVRRITAVDTPADDDPNVSGDD
jgi:hypothetical protein